MVRRNVDDAAVIVTDTHLSYQGLKDEYTDHLTVNHSQMQYRDGLAYTNTVEGLFSHFKRSIIGVYLDTTLVKFRTKTGLIKHFKKQKVD